MNYTKSTFVAFVLIVFVANQAIAQPEPPGFPIDGGISFLVLSGIIYGVYESFRRK